MRCCPCRVTATAAAAAAAASLQTSAASPGWETPQSTCCNYAPPLCHNKVNHIVCLTTLQAHAGHSPSTGPERDGESAHVCARAGPRESNISEDSLFSVRQDEDIRGRTNGVKTPRSVCDKQLHFKSCWKFKRQWRLIWKWIPSWPFVQEKKNSTWNFNLMFKIAHCPLSTQSLYMLSSAWPVFHIWAGADGQRWPSHIKILRNVIFW